MWGGAGRLRPTVLPPPVKRGSSLAYPFTRPAPTLPVLPGRFQQVKSTSYAFLVLRHCWRCLIRDYASCLGGTHVSCALVSHICRDGPLGQPSPMIVK